jgi:hypothetical protein
MGGGGEKGGMKGHAISSSYPPPPILVAATRCRKISFEGMVHLAGSAFHVSIPLNTRPLGPQTPQGHYRKSCTPEVWGR